MRLLAVPGRVGHRNPKLNISLLLFLVNFNSTLFIRIPQIILKARGVINDSCGSLKVAAVMTGAGVSLSPPRVHADIE